MAVSSGSLAGWGSQNATHAVVESTVAGGDPDDHVDSDLFESHLKEVQMDANGDIVGR